MTIRIRPLAEADTDAVVALWHAAELTRPWNDPYRDIERARAVWPDLLLVAADGHRIVGTVLAGYDGHRGWLSYLATDPEHRGEGIGRALVGEAEERLRALGCPKVQLMVRPGNEGVTGFYDALGYTEQRIVLMGKRLVADG